MLSSDHYRILVVACLGYTIGFEVFYLYILSVHTVDENMNIDILVFSLGNQLK